MRHRKDANHDAITDAAEQLGWYVENVSQTDLGYDAILTKAGQTVRAEIKDGHKPMSQQTLTPHEKRVHARLKAHGITVEILTCEEDLLMLERQPRPGSYDQRQMEKRT